MSLTAADDSFESAVERVVRGLEPGEVVTYGEVAAEAGFPGAARAVGTALKRLSNVPWWRVVTASGRLAPGVEREQAERLDAEGVTMTSGPVRRVAKVTE